MWFGCHINIKRDNSFPGNIENKHHIGPPHPHSLHFLCMFEAGKKRRVMDWGALSRVALACRCPQRVHWSPRAAQSPAYLEHTGLSLGSELANEQVGGESCQDGEWHQATGESPTGAAAPGSGLGPAAVVLGQHFHAGCFPKTQPQILCHVPAGLETDLTLGRETPPLNRRPALTVGELITAYSSPWPLLLTPPQHTAPRPARECTAYNRNQVWFKKKKKKKKKKASQTDLCTVCSCAPSFVYRRKSGKSLEEEKSNSSSQWVGQIKIYLFLWFSCVSLESVLLLEVKVRDGEVCGVACRLGNGNQVSITTVQSAAKPSILFEPHRCPFPLHRWEYWSEILEGKGTWPRSSRD